MKTIWIDYTNYKGERAWREILPQGASWAGADHPYHPSRFVLIGVDMAKTALRDFDLLNIHAFSEAAPQSDLLRGAKTATDDNLNVIKLVDGEVSIALVDPPIGLIVRVNGKDKQVRRGTCVDCYYSQREEGPPAALRQRSVCVNHDRYDHHLYLIEVHHDHP